MWFIYLFCCSIVGYVAANHFKLFKEFAHQTRKLFHTKRGKPFDCSFCLGTWFCFGAYYWTAPGWITLIVVSLASGCTAFLYEYSYNSRPLTTTNTK